MFVCSWFSLLKNLRQFGDHDTGIVTRRHNDFAFLWTVMWALQSNTEKGDREMPSLIETTNSNCKWSSPAKHAYCLFCR